MRDQADHEVTAMMKAQFMSLWDGKYDYSKFGCQKHLVLGSSI